MNHKIIHIALDEKFINSAYNQFENAFPNQNIFYILVNDISKNFIYVNPQSNIKKLNLSYDLKDFLDNLSSNNIVIFHSLAEVFYPLVRSLPINLKCIWICFGYEVYRDIRFFNENLLLDTKTQKLYSKGSISLKYKIKEFLRPYIRIIYKNLPLSTFEIKKQVFMRMDYLGCSFTEEYSAIQKYINQKKKLFPFWYYPLEQIVNIDAEVNESRNDIIIGNSGVKSGNHLDAFEKIKNFNLFDRKVIVPLSYGDEYYIIDVLEQGKTTFGLNFQPITSFIPIENYNEIFSRCGIAILNNFRQQAVGSCIGLLWYGSKVFLSTKNPFYVFLKRIGILVYSYEYDLTELSLNIVLTMDEIAHNRKVLKEHLSQSHLIEDLIKQIELIYD